MILSTTQKDIVVTGEDNSKKATINQEKLGKLQYLLTKGLYQDPVGAVIVEWTNNAVDSVVQSGKNPVEFPVLVEITQNKFSVKDVGLGLNKDEFENVCMSYLSSTKEERNDQIGAYGIGLKSFMSLERSATFICRKDGKEAKYLAFAGAEFMEYELIYEKDTLEENGVTCEVDIKNWQEFNEFRDKATKKLSYYDTVVLKVNDRVVDNQIIRSEDWQYSRNAASYRMHLCLKDVYYNINWQSLGLPEIDLPIALRFNLNEGLTPTPSRESLIYNQHTKDAIKKKIEKVCNWFINKYNENVKDEYELIEAWNKIPEVYKRVEIAGKTFDVTDIEKYGTIKFKELKINGINIKKPKEYYDDRKDLLGEYTPIVDYRDSTWRVKGKFYFTLSECAVAGVKIIQVNSVPVGKVKRYLIEKYDIEGYSGKAIFVKKEHIRKLGSVKYTHRNLIDYRYVLGLATEPKEDWRNLISEFKFVEDRFKQFVIDETNVENTQEFNDWLAKDKEIAKQNRLNGVRKGNSNYKRLNKQEGDITLSVGKKGTNTSVIFEKQVFKIENLGNLYKSSKNLHIYFTEEEKEKAKLYYKAFGKKYTVCIIGKRELTKIKEQKQFMTEKQFLKSDKFAKLMSAIKYKDSVKTYKNLYDDSLVKSVLKGFYDQYQKINGYVNENYKEVDEDLLPILKEAADANSLYDKSIEDVYAQFNSNIKKYDFLDCLDTPRSWEHEKIDKYKRLVNTLLLTKSKYNNYEELEIEVKPKNQ